MGLTPQQIDALSNSVAVTFDPADVAPFPLAELEDLRLLLGTFLRKDVLEALGDLNVELNREPIMSEAWTWFLENSENGADCKYAVAFLRRFKNERIETTIEKLKKCLTILEVLRSQD